MPEVSEGLETVGRLSIEPDRLTEIEAQLGRVAEELREYLKWNLVGSASCFILALPALLIDRLYCGIMLGFGILSFITLPRLMLGWSIIRCSSLIFTDHEWTAALDLIGRKPALKIIRPILLFDLMIRRVRSVDR